MFAFAGFSFQRLCISNRAELNVKTRKEGKCFRLKIGISNTGHESDSPILRVRIACTSSEEQSGRDQNQTPTWVQPDDFGHTNGMFRTLDSCATRTLGTPICVVVVARVSSAVETRTEPVFLYLCYLVPPLPRDCGK